MPGNGGPTWPAKTASSRSAVTRSVVIWPEVSVAAYVFTTTGGVVPLRANRSRNGAL